LKKRRAIVWQDAQGEQVLHLINTSAGASGIQTALLAKSNAVVVQETEGDLNIVDATPATAQYVSVRNSAVLLFKDSRTNSAGRLYIPAPLPSIFYAGGDEVDPAQIAGIIAAAEGSLLAGSGNTVDMFTGGYLAKGITRALESTEGVMFVNPMTSTGDLIYSNDSSGDATRLPIGSSGQILEVVGGIPTWSAPSGLAVQIPSARGAGTGSADYTTTSTSYVDVDATNLAPQINCATNDILLITVTAMLSPGSGTLIFSVNVGGTDLGDTDGLIFCPTGISQMPGTFAIQHVVTSGQITSGHTTVKLRFKVGSGSAGTVYNRSAVVRPYISVANLRQ